MKRITMKSQSAFLLFLLSYLSFCLAMPTALRATSTESSQGKVIIEVKEPRETGGKMMISLVNSSESFYSNIEESYYKTMEVPIKELKSTTVVFVVPYGTYAVKLYYDANGNRKLDKFPVLGIPMEPYGFSNNPTTFLGPPSFEEACFIVEGEEATVLVELR